MGQNAAAMSANQPCPFLVPVIADRLWLYPVGAYCRQPDGRVRVPAGATVTCICTTPAHLVCPGYLAGLGRRQQATDGGAGPAARGSPCRPEPLRSPVTLGEPGPGGARGKERG